LNQVPFIGVFCSPLDFFSLNGEFAEQNEKKQQCEKTDSDQQNLQAEDHRRFADDQLPKDLPKKKRVEIFPRNFVIFSSVFHKFHNFQSKYYFSLHRLPPIFSCIPGLFFGFKTKPACIY
jgi:hypothetical protein